MAKGKGLSKKNEISEELEAVVGRGPLARTEIVKKIWTYIKKNDCQDGRIIVPDDTLSAVTGAKPFDMMKLMGKLTDHIYKD